MRMTNKIMQNNSLYNINNNKILQDKLSTQMSTQKKITRPSDDPVIAIRALRLRTNVSELKQFYEKNAPDAESWLEVTEKALGTVTTVLTDMSKQANKGANKDLAVEDLAIIVEQMKSLRDEFYSTGNVDYAGRYVFTGYRTDTTMSFTEEVEEMGEGYPSYDITEQVTIDAFDTLNYTNIGKLDGLNKNNYTDTKFDDTKEQEVSNGDIHRMRLAYDELKAGVNLEIEFRDKNGNKVEFPSSDADGKYFINADGDKVYSPIPDTISTVSVSNDPYSQAINNADAVIYVPETGEVLFGDNAYATLEKAIKNINGTDTEIRFTYTKDSWKNGDLRPEHYFACVARDGVKVKVKEIDPATGTEIEVEKDEIKYNQEYLKGEKEKQVIEYDVGYNQKIQVNTTADEVFTHNLDRDIDDLESALEELQDIDAVRKDMETVLKGLEEGTAEYNDVKAKYDAADKAYSYIRENIHNIFEKTITRTQGYLDETNIAVTDNGTRSQRLSLISNRLMDQKTTFQTLQSDNEDADIAEVAVQLTSTELTYEAALMATGKIMQTSLMNYI